MQQSDTPAAARPNDGLCAGAEARPIRVYQMDDMEWWAGESLAACLAEGRRQCGDDCYLDDHSDQYELTDEQLQRLKFVDEDGSTCTFADELARRIEAGETFPQQFAAKW